MSRLTPGQTGGSTNLVTNGGFETNTTGWAAAGTNTISRDPTRSKSGSASLKTVYSNNGYHAYFSPTLTADVYTGSMQVYISANWDGTNLEIQLRDFAVAGAAKFLDMTKRDQWQLVFVTLDLTASGADLTGTFSLDNATGVAPTVGRNLWIDEVQIELGSVVKQYVPTDGATATRLPSRWVV